MVAEFPQCGHRVSHHHSVLIRSAIPLYGAGLDGELMSETSDLSNAAMIGPRICLRAFDKVPNADNTKVVYV